MNLSHPQPRTIAHRVALAVAAWLVSAAVLASCTVLAIIMAAGGQLVLALIVVVAGGSVYYAMQWAALATTGDALDALSARRQQRRDADLMALAHAVDERPGRHAVDAPTSVIASVPAEADAPRLRLIVGGAR